MGLKWTLLTAILVAAAVGVWLVSTRRPQRYVHPVYTRAQVFYIDSAASRSNASFPSPVSLISQSEARKSLIRTLHAKVKYAQIYFPAYMQYVQSARRAIGSEQQPISNREATVPMTDSTIAEWWVDIAKERIKVKVVDRNYTARLAASAFSNLQDGMCTEEQCTKVHETYYAGYTHRVIVSPPVQSMRDLLLLESDSSWLSFLSLHRQTPIVASADSSPWLQLFGRGQSFLDRLNERATLSIEGFGNTPWGERCYVVRATAKPSDKDQLWLWFSIDKDLTCVRAVWFYNEDKVLVWNAKQLVQHGKVWLPTVATFEMYFRIDKSLGGSPGYVLATQASYDIAYLQVNGQLPVEKFAVSMPPSAWVDDHFRQRLYRYGSPSGPRTEARVQTVWIGLLVVAIVVLYVLWKLLRRRTVS